MSEQADPESVTPTAESADDESATTTDSSGDLSVESEPARDDDHLADVEEGAGCTEIWEHLSEQREASED